MSQTETAPPPAEDPFESSRMTLGEHLEELRTRLVRSTIVLAVVFGIGWFFHMDLAEVFFQPYERASVWLRASVTEKLEAEVAAGRKSWEECFTSPDPETRELLPAWEPKERLKGDTVSLGFFFYMKISAYFALFIGGPYLLWQVWQFVAAGLYRHERSTVMRYFPFSVLLFLGGVVFGYLAMVPYAIFFLADISILQIEYYESINTYMSFLLSLTLALGLVFQLPMLMIALSNVGVIEPRLYRQYRPHFVVCALIVAAIITPPDPFTQMMMAIPMVLLYELGNLVAHLSWRKRAPAPGEVRT